VGLKLSLFMAFILFTGTLAVVSHEIDWLLQPSLRVAPASAEGPVDWPGIAENAVRHPGVAEVWSMEAPTASAFAVKVTVKDAAGDLYYLHAHPTTGAIQGEAPWAGAQRVLRVCRHLQQQVAHPGNQFLRNGIVDIDHAQQPVGALAHHRPDAGLFILQHAQGHGLARAGDSGDEDDVQHGVRNEGGRVVMIGPPGSSP
jgi:hypothetical protein